MSRDLEENHTNSFEQLAIAVMGNIINHRATVEHFGAVVEEIVANLMAMTDTPEFRQFATHLAREQAALLPPPIPWTNHSHRM